MSDSEAPASRASGADRFAIRLSDGERDALRSLIEQLRTMLLVDTDDAGVGRLFPSAYTDDPEREEEYQRLVRDELLEARLAAIGTVVDTLAAKEISEGELAAWMRSLNDLRLVLGTRLDVSEDDPIDVDPDDPDADTRHLYLALGILLEEVVAALAE